jgi:nitrate reductase NapAB chaperone NapD
MALEKAENEVITGLIIRGRPAAIERVISMLEEMRDIRLIYVRRARPPSFLIVVETVRRRGEPLNEYER